MPAKTYSGGMRRRLDLASALIGRPRLLFLDEPTTGLDPRSRLGMWDVIRELVREGTTLLLTTQYLEEADAARRRHRRGRPRHGSSRRAPPTSSRPRSAASGSRSSSRPRLEDVRARAGTGRRRARRGAGVDAHTRRITVPVGRRRAAPGRGGARAGRAGHRDRRHRAATSHPGRRLPQPHRTRGRAGRCSVGRGRPRAAGTGEDCMTTSVKTPPATTRSLPPAVTDSLVVTWRNLKRIPRIPELADLRDSAVDHVRAALRVRVRWRDPRARWRQLPGVPDAGHLRPDPRRSPR